MVMSPINNNSRYTRIELLKEVLSLSLFLLDHSLDGIDGTSVAFLQ